MAITAGICNSYKQEILSGTHTSAHTYKIALYTSAASLSPSSTTASVGTAVGIGKARNAPAGQGTAASVGTATETGKATASATGQSVTASVGTAIADGGSPPAPPPPAPIQRYDSAGSVYVLGTERAREIVRRELPAPHWDPLPHLPDPKKLRISEFQPIKLRPIKVELPPEEPIHYTGTAKPKGIKAASGAGVAQAVASTDEEDMAIILAHLGRLLG